jgi:hypothetical protein
LASSLVGSERIVHGRSGAQPGSTGRPIVISSPLLVMASGV